MRTLSTLTFIGLIGIIPRIRAFFATAHEKSGRNNRILSSPTFYRRKITFARTLLPISYTAIDSSGVSNGAADALRLLHGDISDIPSFVVYSTIILLSFYFQQKVLQFMERWWTGSAERNMKEYFSLRVYQFRPAVDILVLVYTCI